MRESLRTTLGAAWMSCLGFAAAAEPATPEGARAIERAYGEYLSQGAVEKGIVVVSPQGEDYVVTLDFQKAVAAAGGPPDLVAVAPFVYRLTPTLGGGWLATASSFPALTIGPTGKEKDERGAASFEGFRFDGLYDPAAPDFWRSKLGFSALLLDLKTRTTGELQHMNLAQNGVASEMRVRAGEDPDSLDVNLTQSMEGSIERTLEGGDGASGDPEASETRQGAASGDGHVSSFRAAAFGDFWRFLVAHADGAPPAPDALKPKLEALLPLWRELAGRFRLDDVALAFPGGGLTIKSVAQDLKMSGLTADASAEFGLDLKNLGVEIEAAPAWVKAAWPASLQLHVAAGVGGLDRAAHLALDDPDFLKSGDLSDETKSAIFTSLAKGHPYLAVSETRLSTPLVEATFEGVAELAGGDPQAHAKVTADSLDKVLALLAAAGEDEPEVKQLLFAMTFVKGLAKQEDGRLVWNIELAAPDAVIVNGQRLGSD